jgi:hypothetical protein
MPSLQASSAWVRYFRANADAVLDVPWERGADISEQDRAAIAESVQIFQLGESSEGRHFLKCAQDYAALVRDPDYVEAIRCFIREEQRHARDLGRFLTAASVPLLRKSWPDTVFRWLRHGARLESSIMVVLVAEVIAMVYYDALLCATRSAVLGRICEQILRDEVEHIRFQCERLAQVRKKHSRWRTNWMNGLHRFLFGGTCLVVWYKHGRAMKRGGYGFQRFWTAAWRELEQAIGLMEPGRYVEPASVRKAVREPAAAPALRVPAEVGYNYSAPV